MESYKTLYILNIKLEQDEISLRHSGSPYRKALPTRATNTRDVEDEINSRYWFT